jgi:type IV pilus assembly protein PilV
MKIVPFQKTAGFTLLEILVALIILTIGLLGLASLQATGLRNNHSAYLRSQTTILAYEMVDRMRANRPAVLASLYNLNFTDSAPSGSQPQNVDQQNWLNALANNLPSGDGQITCNGTALISDGWITET